MTYTEIQALATKFRNNPTPSELLLWKYLQNRQLDDKMFIRQYPIIYQTTNKVFDYFIADFYCEEEKLVVELEGDIDINTVESHQRRDQLLVGYGLKVIRFNNKDLKNIEDVLARIEDALVTE